MKFITAEELAKSGKNGLLMLDIRDDSKFSASTVPGSINIDVYSDIKQGNYEKARQKLSALPKDKEIITICNAGITAQPASLILESMGYRTKVLENGMIGWNELNLQFRQKDVS
ncbi:rhodanese-like domain-containing protein [Candidatus Woesearchaeota archaeon]|nr:rhodanese-like domain-containing protein [Candidatus Woesearchaeota archaeon]